MVEITIMIEGGVWNIKTKNNYLRTKKNDKIADHSQIAQKNIEEISKPSQVLSTLIQYSFSKEYNGKKKKIKYGKLKTASSLLDCLDVTKLKSNDSEIERFYQHIKGN